MISTNKTHVYLNHMLLKPGDDYYFDESDIPVLTLSLREKDVLTVEHTPSSVEDLQAKLNNKEDILSTSNYIYKWDKWIPINEMEKFVTTIANPALVRSSSEVDTKESFASQIGKLARYLESIANYLTVTKPRTEAHRHEIENVQLPVAIISPNHFEDAALDALKLAAHARVCANELFDQYTAWQRASNEYERESAAWLDTSATFRRLKDKQEEEGKWLTQEEWLRQSKVQWNPPIASEVRDPEKENS